ncbi:helix-turn-helix domain-containing protein [Qipengyuania sp. ASV99]|uniref:helix-turn-helix domain-containing protein n=1 Tax=Qipengyuania sp. ASV99 TaxID=3399681 RepID=UPI003A4C6996
MAMKAHLATLAPGSPANVDGRRAVRRALQLETSGVFAGSGEANVTVHNISAAGLLLETGQALAVGDMLAIELPELGAVGAEIVWKSERLYGCAFQQALGEAALSAAQLRAAAPGAAPAPISAVPPASQRSGTGDWLGEKFNRLRRERGLTLAQVADAMGVSKPTVWAWEKGKARPLPERLTSLAEVLGVSEDEINESGTPGEAAALVDECRQRIASAYGINPNSIRIMLEI